MIHLCYSSAANTKFSFESGKKLFPILNALFASFVLIPRNNSGIGATTPKGRKHSFPSETLYKTTKLDIAHKRLHPQHA